ncbi:probable ADE12-adenylosuccinate synthetase [Fusarium fujikuroi IMI 58289]|uniref:Adenylosuccinate synthetase n=1 Tax=Gibberella fujikuroi (strain CBS 195.34 / IMI 58289 / NRRL A-6831) TaxID=1279085 RepID=S0DUG6_GIBF5|nr:probable ADE12-adenylosuccinate synthetase [Fusarium fujikuroi IMI 58289]CCT64198.1 probable ADE12-adenylosuccinate synthetase [Fusarium fujikuroi IMI 58289]SCO05820.1 probable ADE12-adenylosuccinate synthetase [Fusarium fujikuroi]SCO37776.1 probable ADE12-adenylosuccinate synthetase [Fusarium fujikuroi]
MAITVILGAQWGDEGVSTQGELNTTDDTQALTILQKGKLVDGQCQEAQLCARAAGGHNAGHLVRPSFFSELKELEKNLTAVHDRILVSDRVNILLDLHIAVDGLEEEELGDAAIGTTRRGMLTPGLHDGLSLSAFVTSSQTFPNLNGVDNPSIGPCYQTSRARTGIKMTDVFNPEVFEQKLRRLANGFQKRFGELLKYDIEAELARFDEYRQTLSKYVVDGVAFMKSAQESNMKIVIEGANALMLDVDYGSYPFVTSSSTTLAGIIGGLALNPKNITETVGVVKAYTTRVGAGAFKTEDTEEIGTKLQEIGREWGTSTGRRRRCGWLGRYNLETLSNLVVVKYSNSINYYDSLNLTKLDVLDTFETIKIAIAYKIDGEELDSYPADLDILNRAEVVYHEMPGWQKPTTNARTYYDLPRAARDYIEYIEKFVGVKIKYIGTGPDREAMVQRA